MGKDLKRKEFDKGIIQFILPRKKKNGIGSRKHLWQCNGQRNDPFAKISMLKSLEIKGFIGGNRENEIRNRYSETDFINVHISC